jgi:hypothetical protein
MLPFYSAYTDTNSNLKLFRLLNGIVETSTALTISIWISLGSELEFGVQLHAPMNTKELNTVLQDCPE